MSTNCIRCVVKKRTGPDLLCNECRSKAPRLAHGQDCLCDECDAATLGLSKARRARLTSDQPQRPITKERTCVYCGCTDSRACAEGCSWVEKHQYTSTGVCSRCVMTRLQRFDIGNFTLITPGPTRDDEKIWMENMIGEGMEMDVKKLEAVLEKFFKEEF